MVAEVPTVATTPVLDTIDAGFDALSMQLDCFESFVAMELGYYCCTLTFLASGGSYGFLGRA